MVCGQTDGEIEGQVMQTSRGALCIWYGREVADVWRWSCRWGRWGVGRQGVWHFSCCLVYLTGLTSSWLICCLYLWCLRQLQWQSKVKETTSKVKCNYKNLYEKAVQLLFHSNMKWKQHREQLREIETGHLRWVWSSFYQPFDTKISNNKNKSVVLHVSNATGSYGYNRSILLTRKDLLSILGDRSERVRISNTFWHLKWQRLKHKHPECDNLIARYSVFLKYLLLMHFFSSFFFTLSQHRSEISVCGSVRSCK